MAEEIINNPEEVISENQPVEEAPATAPVEETAAEPATEPVAEPVERRQVLIPSTGMFIVHVLAD